MSGATDINTFPLHLGLGGRVEKIDDPFDGTPDCYMRYGTEVRPRT